MTHHLWSQYSPHPSIVNSSVSTVPAPSLCARLFRFVVLSNRWRAPELEKSVTACLSSSLRHLLQLLSCNFLMMLSGRSCSCCLVRVWGYKFPLLYRWNRHSIWQCSSIDVSMTVWSRCFCRTGQGRLWDRLLPLLCGQLTVLYSYQRPLGM